MARETGEARLSDAMPMGSKMVVEWAIPYKSAGGGRIYVQGIPASAFADFLEGSLGNLRDLPEFEDAETVWSTATGSSSAEPGRTRGRREAARRRPAGRARGGRERDLRRRPLLRERRDRRLTVQDRSEHERGRSLRQHPGQPQDAPVDHLRRLRAHVDRRAAAAAPALEAAAELERRELNERHAVEINDNIIQGLALAKYQMQRGQDEAGDAQLSTRFGRPSGSYRACSATPRSRRGSCDARLLPRRADPT